MKLFAIVIIVAGIATTSFAQTTEHEAKTQNKETVSKNEKPDANFAMEAAEGGLMEVMLGRLALTNGGSQGVKDFGQMMVDDHSKANDELKALAQRKGILLPDSLGRAMQNEYDRLAKKTGNDFDDAYIDLMVKDHRKDIGEFRKEADSGNDADFKAWAAGKMPTLRHHLQNAVQLQKPAEKK